MWKAKGQKRIFNGAYKQMNHPTNRLMEQALYFVLPKETRLNAWFVSTSLRPIMKQSTKL